MTVEAMMAYDTAVAAIAAFVFAGASLLGVLGVIHILHLKDRRDIAK
jgi:hypothetical protein